MTDPVNVLFICSRNQWRSPTAEQLWRSRPGYQVRSAGTSPKAKRTVSEADVRWADRIFVMEKKHKNRMTARFSRMLDFKMVHVLDVPDEYRYMQAELIDELEGKLALLLP